MDTSEPQPKTETPQPAASSKEQNPQKEQIENSASGMH